jgi:hypothetical protein
VGQRRRASRGCSVAPATPSHVALGDAHAHAAGNPQGAEQDRVVGGRWPGAGVIDAESHADGSSMPAIFVVLNASTFAGSAFRSDTPPDRHRAASKTDERRRP